jgi:hypothetical protein
MALETETQNVRESQRQCIGVRRSAPCLFDPNA